MSFFKRARNAIFAHKVISTILIVVIITSGYISYKHIKNASAGTQYALSRVSLGSITQTVTGTGQVAAAHQLDVKSQVSGTVQTINVKVGDHVYAGQLLATIDSKDAAVSLQNARISYAKLTQPPKESEITSAQNSLSKSYGDAFNTISSTFLDLPNIMSGMNDLLYGQSTFLSNQNSVHLSTAAQDYRNQSGISFDKAAKEYSTVLQEYKSLNRESSKSSIDQLLSHTYSMSKDVATALQNMQNTITYIKTNQPEYFPSLSTQAATNVTSWSTTVNGDVSSLLSAQNSISSSQNSLTTLTEGADPLDIQSGKLSLSQQEQNYSNYFIKAPFDGIVGRIPINIYDQASGGTVIATIVGDQKISTISLNEVDAAKVCVGQPVRLTFDAIDNLNATGTVSEVDLVGTVTQGVVTYNVKIIINTSDERIRPGMSINATIITNELNNVLVVPSSAVKTQGNRNYVQILNASSTFARNANPRETAVRPSGNNSDLSASSTRASGRFASSTRQLGSMNSGNGFNFANGNLTISSSQPPSDQTVVVGLSDDTNTQILSGLSAGQFVVTRTISTSATQTTAPSIFNSIGGNRSGAGTRPGNATFRVGG